MPYFLNNGTFWFSGSGETDVTILEYEVSFDTTKGFENFKINYDI